jgi:hypothetical protein
VVAHVLDAAGNDDVGRTHSDLASAGRHRGPRAGTHAVEREAGDSLRDPREQPDVAAQREALVADLSGGGEDDVADPVRRKAVIPAQELANDLDSHVVRAGLPEESLRSGAPEGGPQSVYVEDFLQRARHMRTILRAEPCERTRSSSPSAKRRLGI